MNRLLLLISMFSITGGTGLITCLGKNPEISGYHFKHVVPLPGKQGFIYANTDYDVFYYGHLMLYKVYYSFDSSRNNQYLVREERNYFLVYNRDSAFGQVYFQKPFVGKMRDRVSVDSIVSRVRYESNAYDTFLRMKMDSSYYEGKDLVKVYQIEPTAAFPEKYTYSFCYSPDVNPPTEYFSRAMDNVKNMRLYKIKTFAHGGQWPNQSIYFPERELTLEMRHSTDSEKKEAMYYFKKYLEENK